MKNKIAELTKLFLSLNLDESPKVKVKGFGETCLVRDGEVVTVVDDNNNCYDLGALEKDEIDKFIKKLK